MSLVARDGADILNLDPEDLFLAGSIFRLEPFIMEKYNSRLYRYRAVAIIPKDSNINSLNDLRGKNSCHTGYGRTAGWNVPIGILLNEQIMSYDCRGLLYSAENFFQRSCAAGIWSKDPLVDMHLKKQHPHLCELCKDPTTCTSTDEYSGYEGAIKCLLDKKGQIAFTSLETVIDYFARKSNELADNYEILCLNGKREKISHDACYWAKRPTNVWVMKGNKDETKKNTEKSIFYNILEQVHFRSRPTHLRTSVRSWFDKVLTSSLNITTLEIIPPTPNGNGQALYTEYLGDYIKSIQKPRTDCKSRTVRMCVTSQKELSKCLDMQKVAFSRRILPEIRCENPGFSIDSCIKSIKDNQVDIISLDSGFFYKAAKYHGLKPIAQERINHTGIEYYSVAVVRAPSEIFSLDQLHNVSVCSTGFGDIAGWVAPIGTLTESDIITRETCTRSSEVSKFFRAMCVPGAGDYRYNIHVNGAAKLCSLCVGDGKGEHVCEKSHSEMYSSELGAFRCLVERKGDVAFLSHTTPLIYTSTQRRATEYWATNLRPYNFRLLCKQGGQATLDSYEECNLAKIPSRFLVTSGDISYENYTEIVDLLTRLSDTFTNKAKYSFKIFGEYDGSKNVIFGDDTTELIAYDYHISYESALGSFLPIIQTMDTTECQNSAMRWKINQWLIKGLLIVSLVVVL